MVSNPDTDASTWRSTEVNYVADPFGDITKYDPRLPGNISQQQKYMCRGCAK